MPTPKPRNRAPGGGRKPTGVVEKAITMTPAQYAKAQRIGKGNASKGVRVAVDNMKEDGE